MADREANFERSDRPLIQVVDDEWLIAASIETDLVNGGYDVAGPVGSVGKALHLIESNSVHGAVLDIQLTGETSFPVAAALKVRRIPYLFVTGFSRDQLPTEHDASMVLSKPVDKKDLLAAMEDLLAL